MNLSLKSTISFIAPLTLGIAIGSAPFVSIITFDTTISHFSSKPNLSNGSCVRNIFNNETGIVLNQTYEFNRDQLTIGYFNHSKDYIGRNDNGSPSPMMTEVLKRLNDRPYSVGDYPAALQPIPCDDFHLNNK
jgi:hypothetical protein